MFPIADGDGHKHDNDIFFNFKKLNNHIDRLPINQTETYFVNIQIFYIKKSINFLAMFNSKRLFQMNIVFLAIRTIRQTSI